MTIDIKEVLHGLIGMFNPSPLATLTNGAFGDDKILALHKDYVPRISKGPRRNRVMHDFTNPCDYVEFLQGLVTVCPDAGIFFNEKQYQLTALSDPSDIHGDQISCSIEFHRRFKEWTQRWSNGCIGTPADAALFLREHLRDIEPNGEAILGAFSSLRLVKTGDVAVEASPFGGYSIVNTTGKAELKTEIPERFTIKLPIFAAAIYAGNETPHANANERGEREYELTIKVIINTTGDTPTICLALWDLEEVLSQARDDMREFVASGLNKPVYRGTPRLVLAPMSDSACSVPLVGV